MINKNNHFYVINAIIIIVNIIIFLIFANYLYCIIIPKRYDKKNLHVIIVMITCCNFNVETVIMCTVETIINL